MQDLERELKMLNMKKTIFQENSEPEEKMHFDFSKKLYIKEQQCAAILQIAISDSFRYWWHLMQIMYIF